MKISINNKLIKRNKLISQIVLYGALGLIGLGILVTLSNPNSAQVLLVYLVLVPAYLLIQLNVLMADRWGKSPRLDEIITQALKGLDNRYSLYLYTTDIPYLLVGPAGIWIINSYHQSGTIIFDEEKKKYQQKGGGNFLSKLFNQDSLSDIDRESKDSRKKLEKYFNKIGLTQYPQPIVVNVFYNADANVKAQNAPEKTYKIDKLKDSIRQTGKHPIIFEENMEKILQKLPKTE